MYFLYMSLDELSFWKEMTGMPVKKGKTRVTVTLDKELYNKLNELADEESRTLSGQIRHELKMALYGDRKKGSGRRQ